VRKGFCRTPLYIRKGKVEFTNIDLREYNYELPPARIARYPVEERDLSKVLVFKDNIISEDTFRNIYQYLPAESLLVFNNTRVIRARILFRKESGAGIEILCLEPLSPSDYELSFGSRKPVEWKCIAGNLRKWKSGIIRTSFPYNGREYVLTAEKMGAEGEALRIRFEWGTEEITFGEVTELAGILPLPPYLEREAVDEDLNRYQTVYSRIRGSVAAPTAGLHFTGTTLDKLSEAGITTAELTLHVGAGTFKPVKTADISQHEMHFEHFLVTKDTIDLLLKFKGRIIPVGTTSVRTLESLYWLGNKINAETHEPGREVILGQWEAYKAGRELPLETALQAILNYMQQNNLAILNASTGIMILPGYKFRVIDGMITNFHQPMSTLLLLVSAFIGKKWVEIYDYALKNNFRFLSYGDCSLLLK